MDIDRPAASLLHDTVEGAAEAAVRNRSGRLAGTGNSELEEDHLVPLELGGAPRDPKNLWPEPRHEVASAGQAAEDKDTVENNLKKQVCDGSMTLDAARKKIISDWTH